MQPSPKWPVGLKCGLPLIPGAHLKSSLGRGRRRREAEVEGRKQVCTMQTQAPAEGATGLSLSAHEAQPHTPGHADRCTARPPQEHLGRRAVVRKNRPATRTG